MIENRIRLEREIMKGRQTVRKSTRPPERGESGAKLPPPSRGGKDILKGAEALPIESEAEQEFADGSERFFKRQKGLHRTNSNRSAVGLATSTDGAHLRIRSSPGSD